MSELDNSVQETTKKTKKWLPWVIIGGVLLIIIPVTLLLIFVIFTPQIVKKTASTTSGASVDILGNDTHTDFKERREYEFDDAGIVIGETVFHSTQDDIVYMVVHYQLDGATEIYRYDEKQPSATTQITWMNGSTTKEFLAGEFIETIIE